MARKIITRRSIRLVPILDPVGAWSHRRPAPAASEALTAEVAHAVTEIELDMVQVSAESGGGEAAGADESLARRPQRRT